MRYILDTNVISELVAKKPDQQVITWVAGVDEDLLYLSVITIGEIKKGIEKLPASARKEQLTAWLEQELLERFKIRLVPLDVEVFLKWGELVAGLDRSGKSMPAIDSLIAACALQGGFVLVTRNTGDFAAAGIQTLNPWE
jgi:tRNA(fMet)-specific endonuclease VapC